MQHLYNPLKYTKDKYPVILMYIPIFVDMILFNKQLGSVIIYKCGGINCIVVSVMIISRCIPHTAG